MSCGVKGTLPSRRFGGLIHGNCRSCLDNGGNRRPFALISREHKLFILLMNVTKFQLKLLKFYSKYQTEPLTLFKIMRPFWSTWLLLLIVPIFGCYYIRIGLPSVGWFFIGGTIGAFLRDVNRILSLFRTWPMLHKIINWERLMELLKDNEESTANSSNSN